jgi:hypothetical protein
MFMKQIGPIGLWEVLDRGSEHQQTHRDSSTTGTRPCKPQTDWDVSPAPVNLKRSAPMRLLPRPTTPTPTPDGAPRPRYCSPMTEAT